jgi:hypothetical protein
VPAASVDLSRAALAADPSGEQQIRRAVTQMQQTVDSMQSSTVAQHAMAMMQRLEAPQEIVCYGIGDIINSNTARLQLALALSLASGLGLDRSAVSFFDPVLTQGGDRVLTDLGITVTQENENCRRRVPDGGNSLFFMPHCDREMYNNVIGANIVGAGNPGDAGVQADASAAEEPAAGDDGGSTAFTQLSILGNSFNAYEERSAYDQAVRQCKYLLIGASRCVEQPLLDTGEEFGPGVFNDTALHTFP